MDLNNAHVLVTGGSSGIGKETARQLINAGAKVVIAARNEEKLNQAANETGAIPVACDVGDEKQVFQLMEKTQEALGHYNVLINNAGYGRHEKLVETPPKR